MSRYSEFKKKSLENPKILEAYEALQPEYDIIQAMIDARKSLNMTQRIYPQQRELRRRISAE